MGERARGGRVEGKVAFITGAAGGQGRSHAVRLAEEGADIIAVDLCDEIAGAAYPPATLEDLAQTERAVAALGRRVITAQADVRDVAALRAVLDPAVAELGGLDIVVNNAAVTAHVPALELSVADWDAVMRTNLRGAFLVARAAGRVMKERGGGRIVNLSSPFARVGLADRVAYSVSKAGLEQLTRSLAVEWAPYGITVNAVAPTTVLTESRQHVFADEAALQRRIAQIPLGRVARTDDVVGAVLFLCADAGAFVTGETILVDGGYTIGRS